MPDYGTMISIEQAKPEAGLRLRPENERERERARERERSGSGPYDNPNTRPLMSISIPSPPGLDGNPGMSDKSPVTAVMNPAPADSRTSRTGIRNPRGRPFFDGSAESERCVLAMQTGYAPYPAFSSAASRSG